MVGIPAHEKLVIIMIEINGLTKTSVNNYGKNSIEVNTNTGVPPSLISRIDAGKSALVSKALTKPRLYFVDNLRILLTILVITQHAAQTYSAGGAWFLPVEPSPLINTLLLGMFQVVNMSFFMGLFFMISAYFVPGSYERKGAATFYKDRLIRLGIPIVVFSLLVFPVMLYLLHGSGVTSFVGYYLNSYLTLSWQMNVQGFTVGHLWFLLQLLILSGIYVIFRKANGSRSSNDSEQASTKKIVFPSNLAIVTFTLALGLAMFAVRIVFPVNTWLIFQIVEPAHYPEYVALFAVGILAFRNDWFNTLPAATARKWGYVTVLAIIALFPMFIIFRTSITDGGLTMANITLSMWEAIVCVGMCISLIYLFRNRFNFQGKIAKALSDNTFTVYLIHIPIIVFLQYLLIGVNIHPLVKFAIVCLLGVLTSFLLSHYVVRRLPYAKYVL